MLPSDLLDSQSGRGYRALGRPLYTAGGGRGEEAMPERVGVAVFGCGGVSSGHFGAYASIRRPLVPAGVSL